MCRYRSTAWGRRHGKNEDTRLEVRLLLRAKHLSTVCSAAQTVAQVHRPRPRLTLPGMWSRGWNHRVCGPAAGSTESGLGLSKTEQDCCILCCSREIANEFRTLSLLYWTLGNASLLLFFQLLVTWLILWRPPSLFAILYFATSWSSKCCYFAVLIRVLLCGAIVTMWRDTIQWQVSRDWSTVGDAKTSSWTW